VFVSTDVETGVGKGIIMFGKALRSPAHAEVRFCDSCAEVSTAAERARRRYEDARTAAQALVGPR
jgi:hypothetical protein